MKRIYALSAAIALAVATTAGAATIDVTWNSPVFVPPSADSVSVTITAPPFASSGIETGRFQGALANPTPLGIQAFFPNYPTLFAYCYELTETLNPGGTINYTLDAVGDPDVLNWLGAVNDFIPAGGVLDWLNPVGVGPWSASVMASAIQLGIWEARYEAGGPGLFNLLSGNIVFGGVDASVLAAYTAIVGSLGSPDLPAGNVFALTNRGRQDVITGTDEQFDIPEPGSLALLSFAALAAGLARRRKH